MKTVLTHTGKIYVDTEHRLEFLTVGDYGKENNIKADFLGLTKENQWSKEYSSRPKQEMGSNYFNSERLSYAL